MVKLKDKIISKVDYLSKAKLARGSNVHDFLVAKTTVSGNNFHRTCCFVSNEAAGPAAAAINRRNQTKFKGWLQMDFNMELTAHGRPSTLAPGGAVQPPTSIYGRV
jgi:putative AlgH/UPF0301 family transcriptional regulator